LHHIEKTGWPADIVAVTGDLIQDDSREAYERFCELMTPLGLPVHCVPGNHDVRSLMSDAVSMPPFYYCDTLKIGKWLIVGVDSCLDGDAAGEISDSEMRRLEQTIEDADGPNILVCLHHPPLPLGSQWLDQVGLRNGDAFLQLISRSGTVRGVLFGHVHQAFDQHHGDIRIIGTPSTCTQFKPDSESFALDDKPPAYRRISLHDDGTVDSELIWL